MTKATVLLISPPVAKSCEPPAGIAKLAGVLERHGIDTTVLDAGLEGVMCLIHGSIPDTDTWTQRAVRNRNAHIRTLTDAKGFGNPDRYRRAVSDLNRLLTIAARPKGVEMGLANYQADDLSPLNSANLLQAAHTPETNPFFTYFSKRLTGMMDKLAPSLVGFSLNYLSQALTTFAMVGYLRHISPQTPVAVGGGLITSWMSDPHWQDPFDGLFDRMVPGAGDGALLDILGVSARFTHSTPNYDRLSSQAYLSPGFVLPYSASNGCYWNRCTFCPERAEGNAYQPVPVSNALSDLHVLSAATHPVLIHLLDNAVSPNLMEAIIENPPGPSWYGFTRITFQLTDPDFCRRLKQSGCVMLKLGLESGDEKVLESLDKGIDLEIAAKALTALADAGIATYVYLIFGTTAETRAEAEKTLAFTVNHSDNIGFLNLAIFNLPAHGPEHPQLNTSDFYTGDLSLYRDFGHPGGWHRQQVRDFLDREFKRHPAIAPILRRTPPTFTSNHAPFFVLS